MVMAEFPKNVKMADIKKHVGMFGVVWRNDSKQAAKILGYDEKESRFTFELISGPDKGDKYDAKFDPTQEVMVYDNGTVLLAVLDA